MSRRTKFVQLLIGLFVISFAAELILKKRTIYESAIISCGTIACLLGTWAGLTGMLKRKMFLLFDQVTGLLALIYGAITAIGCFIIFVISLLDLFNII